MTVKGGFWTETSTKTITETLQGKWIDGWFEDRRETVRDGYKWQVVEDENSQGRIWSQKKKMKNKTKKKMKNDGKKIRFDTGEFRAMHDSFLDLHKAKTNCFYSCKKGVLRPLRTHARHWPMPSAAVIRIIYCFFFLFFNACERVCRRVRNNVTGGLVASALYVMSEVMTCLVRLKASGSVG